MLMNVLGIIGIISLFVLDRFIGLFKIFRDDREYYRTYDRRRRKDWPYFY